MNHLVEAKSPSPQLVARVKVLCARRPKEAEFLIPILSWLTREEVTHTYLDVDMHPYLLICSHTYLQTSIQAGKNTCTPTERYTCIHTYMHTHIHTYTHTHIHAYMHKPIHAYTHRQCMQQAPPPCRPSPQVLPVFARLVDMSLPKFNAALARILQGSVDSGPPLTPTEVIIALHVIEPTRDSVPLKKVMEACSACLDQRSVFTQQVLAKALNQLVERTPLPLLFMRTVLQAINHFPALVGTTSLATVPVTREESLILASVLWDPVCRSRL